MRASISLLSCAPLFSALSLAASDASAGSRSVKISRAPALQVDLGYEIYEGNYNATTGLNQYKSMRYAASTAGGNRFQAPQPPLQNRNGTIQATEFRSRCPQNPNAPTPGVPYNFTGSEDCLFLSVYAAPNATNLPVFFYIHGGGYGAGDGTQDLSAFMNDNGNAFVSVVIQYRLGAFGFLAGDEIHRDGVANAGLLDQHFALQWVQNYIHLFGGDPSRVTICGESAGGGSVMLQAMAYNGSEGTTLFQNIIASSPYLPMQYGYADWQPSQTYYAFAMAAGCFPGHAYGNTSTTIFDCLVNADSKVLQNASYRVSSSGTYGTWAFLPVTDGTFLQQRPSQQLLSGPVNGARVLSGNNANEGAPFTIQNITTETAFEDWTRLQLPMFNDTDIDALLQQYPSTSAPVNPSDPRFSTTGTSGPSALNESEFGTGQQQRADNVYAETTFVCPSYWLALAFSASNYSGAYKYQFSIPASQHGADLSANGLNPAGPNVSPNFTAAFSHIWGNFIVNDNPSISSELANGNGSSAVNDASNWPKFSRSNPLMLNLNETATNSTFSISLVIGAPNVTEYEGPGLQNNIYQVNAWTWEAGRGDRCDFWADYGAKVPE